MSKLTYKVANLIDRGRHAKLGSVVKRAKELGKHYNKNWVLLTADMLYEAGVKGTNFQDYIDWDYALLTRKERATYMSSSISAYITRTYSDPAQFHHFENKVDFNRTFKDYIGREWILVSESSVEELKNFVVKHEKVIVKRPIGFSGDGVDLVKAKDVSDWEELHARLASEGYDLVEEYVRQHEVLQAIAPGTLNTLRFTTWWDGHKCHILNSLQKFGVGESPGDQQFRGGMFVMLDEHGHATSQGGGYNWSIFKTHPDSGFLIEDYQTPMWDEIHELLHKLCQVVPGVPYVGWDIAITPRGPIVIEGNRSVGIYENRVSVTGRREGTRPRFEKIIGFKY